MIYVSHGSCTKYLNGEAGEVCILTSGILHAILPCALKSLVLKLIIPAGDMKQILAGISGSKCLKKNPPNDPHGAGLQSSQRASCLAAISHKAFVARMTWAQVCENAGTQNISTYRKILSGTSALHIQPRHFIPDKKLLGEILWIGEASFL